MPELEIDLLNRAVKGDQDAFTILLEHFGPIVRARINGKIPEHRRSLLTEDDVMQESYAESFLEIGNFRYQGEGSFAAWLTTLAHRNLLDALRELDAIKRGGQYRRVEPVADDDSHVRFYERLGAKTTTPSREAARGEAKSALHQALQQLPEVYRRVVVMYDLEEQPIEDVAAALGRSAGAVFMLRNRAHKMLQRVLGAGSKFF